MKIKKYLISGPAVLILLLSAGCDRNRNHAGWDYFPDMFYSEAYESYTPNPNFEDGKTMQAPVEGTIPQGFVPFPYTIAEEDRILAGEELVNPYSNDRSVLERGKDAYVSFCQNCHGEKGKGDGYLHTSGRYMVVPRSLAGETAQNLKDGEIYHSITVGYGSMGPQGSQIRPDDRWKIVTYIREELQKQENKENSPKNN